MRVLSLFSGVGGMDYGLDTAGHQIVAMCEIDPKCRSVLTHRFPNIPVHDDVTTLDGKQFDGRVDIVAGGSPCQDLSVAGRRAGLDGERSGLFWHQCRVATQSAARWVLWENVAGALSSNNGTDFAAVLWGLTGCEPAVPEDGWRSAGVCVGPDRTAVWRLFDARWFGVAQRRRRVFVVAGPRDECGPEILFESESCPRDSAPSGTSGPVAAGPVGGGSDKHRRDEFVGSLTAMDGWERPDNAHAEAGWLVPALTTRCGLAVRRLTPRECERLMGWPDDWTRWDADGNEIADGPRYGMCGNGVVAPVAAWIGRRLP